MVISTLKVLVLIPKAKGMHWRPCELSGGWVMDPAPCPLLLTQGSCPSAFADFNVLPNDLLDTLGVFISWYIFFFISQLLFCIERKMKRI